MDAVLRICKTSLHIVLAMRLLYIARYFIAALVGAVLAELTAKRLDMSNSLTSACNVRGDTGTGPFVLAITLKLKPEKKEAWLRHWGELADYVRKNEPDTLAYEVAVLESDSNKIFVYERYTNKEALTEVHQKSEPFGSFKAIMNELDPYEEKSGFGAYETGIGHMIPQRCT